MITFVETDRDTLESVIRKHQSHKPKFSNYFFIDLDNVSYYEVSDTLILIKYYEHFHRVYFLSNNSETLVDILNKLSSNDVINIPFKRDLSKDILDVLYKSGYTLFEVYERMYNSKVDYRGNFNANLANSSDVSDLYNLMMDNFNPFTDTLPNKTEIKDLIDKKWVLVSRGDDQRVNGTLILKFEPKKCYFYIWVSSSNFRESLNLFLNGFNYMHEKGYEMAYLWVRQSNNKPRKLYQTLGFQFDGLKDYTFTKQ